MQCLARLGVVVLRFWPFRRCSGPRLAAAARSRLRVYLLDALLCLFACGGVAALRCMLGHHQMLSRVLAAALLASASARAQGARREKAPVASRDGPAHTACACCAVLFARSFRMSWQSYVDDQRSYWSCSVLRIAACGKLTRLLVSSFDSTPPCLLGYIRPVLWCSGMEHAQSWARATRPMVPLLATMARSGPRAPTSPYVPRSDITR